MRAKEGEIWREERHVKLTFEGQNIIARKGETIAAALTAGGVHALHTTRAGAARGAFCGTGACQNCLVEVDGRPNRRACMTTVDGPMEVRRQDPDLPPKYVSSDFPDRHPASEISPDVLVLGGGIGGLTAAACAAEAGASVVLADERPFPGGQFLTQPLAFSDLPQRVFNDRQIAGGRALIDRARKAGVRFLRGEAWAAFAPMEVHIRSGLVSRVARPGRLIVATGAFERVLPVSGWTLPGVMTTGAAQTLLRAYRVLPGERVLVAGNGLFNLQVAAELAEAGASVAGVVELGAPPSLRSAGALWRMAVAAPGPALQAAGWLRRLKRAGVPVHYGHVLARVDAAEGGVRAAVRSRGADGLGAGPDFKVDAVLMGYGLIPSNEILRLLGCAHVYDPAKGTLVTVRDASCATTVPGVYGVGDCCGIGGAMAAQAEGVIAGLKAAEEGGYLTSPPLQREAREAQRALRRQKRFQAGLKSVFRADWPGLSLATARTVVCRCEEVTLSQINTAVDAGAQSMAEIKRCTRLGMGRCQGRFCAPLLADLLQERYGHVSDEDRAFASSPPVRPVPIGVVADG